jgi:putative ABC transport system permease protein
MNALVRWFVLRRMVREWARTLLTVAGVALGVGVFVSVRVANRSALGSFTHSVDAVTGRANLQVSSRSGPFDERVFPRVRAVAGTEAVTPIVEAWAPVVPRAGSAAEAALILGLDPLREAPFDRAAALDDPRAQRGLAALLEPRAVAVTRSFAGRQGLREGDRFAIRVSGHPESLTVRAIVQSEALDQALGGNVIVADIATAQEVFGRIGTLDRIDLRIDPGRRGAVRAALARALPAGLTVELPRARTRQVENLVAAFALNLTALSLVTVFVALFLILNAVGLSVLRLRREIGVLRTLGVTRAQVSRLFLIEGATLGLVGSTLGLAVGMLLARVTLGAVSRTLVDLYLVRQAGEARLDPVTGVIAVMLGVAVALVAAWAPAREASRTPPASAAREGAWIPIQRASLVRWNRIALVILVAAGAAALWTVGERQPYGGFVSAALALTGTSLLAPAAVRIGARLARRPLAGAFGVSATLGAGYLTESLVRSAVVVAAIAVSVGMTVGLTLMVGSFRRTVDTWITQTVRGDLYVEPAGHRISGPASRLSEAFVDRVRAIPEVMAVDSFRGQRMVVDGALTMVAGIDFAVQARIGALRLTDGRRVSPVLDAALREGGAIVSESFAHRHRVRTGASIAVPTPEGLVRLPVKGVFYDYTTDAGIVFVDRARFARLWHDRRTESLALYLAPGADPDRVRRTLLSLAGPGEWLQVTPHRILRARVLEIFDQTFRITWALQAIAVLVAVLGVFATLTALVVERGRDLGVLRAVGALRSQVRTIVLVESGLLGGIGALLGCALGVVLALLLVHVINRQFFGWTIQFAFAPGVLVEAVVLMVGASLVAALAPARRAARRVPGEAMRDE